MDSLHNFISSLCTKFNFIPFLHNADQAQPRNSAVDESDSLLLKLKNRFNYAGASCSARIVSSNAGSQSASALLNTSKDVYLRNLCATPAKFVVIELCEEVKIDSIVLANYELFSSTFKSFKAFGAAKNGKAWRFLAKGQMKPGKFLHSDQAFSINEIMKSTSTDNNNNNNNDNENIPNIVTDSNQFFKYLKIEFDDQHHGNEHFCPVSSVRVYGKTMLDEFEEEVNTKQNQQADETNSSLPIIFQGGLEQILATSRDPQLKTLIHQMTRLSAKISHIQKQISFFTHPLHHASCHPKLEGELVRLQSTYTALESRCFAAINSEHSRSHGGNVFKAINERLKTLEQQIIAPVTSGGSFKFFNSVLKQTAPSQLFLEDSNHAGIASFENLADLITEISGLKHSLKRVNSAILGLFAMNVSFILVLLVLFIRRRRSKNNNNNNNNRNSSRSPELLRRPLSELKSPSVSSGSLQLQHSRNNSTSSMPSGILLSDDEVLLFDGLK